MIKYVDNILNLLILADQLLILTKDFSFIKT